MSRAVGEVLSYGVLVAISLVPMIGIIVILFSSRARVNGPVFVLGWAAPLAAVSGVVYVLADGPHATTSWTRSAAVSWIKLVLGALCFVMAIRVLRTATSRGEELMPRWFASIDGLTAPRAFGIATFCAIVSPKNLVLTVGAGVAVAKLGVPSSDAVAALLVFVVLASFTVAVPLLYYLVAGPRAKPALKRLKDWLLAHGKGVTLVVLVAFGGALVADALSGLAT